ncbi:MAG: hypothetical protein Q9191_006284 [Dirinaria sp. TL-2023a]
MILRPKDDVQGRPQRTPAELEYETDRLAHSRNGKPTMPTHTGFDAAIARRDAREITEYDLADDMPPLTPEVERRMDVSANFDRYNVSLRTELAAAAGHDPADLTDKQVRAVIAAAHSPEDESDHDMMAGSRPEIYQTPSMKKYVAHIYKVMNAGFSEDDIHSLFHSKDGKPIRPTDQEVDAAIVAHAKPPMAHATPSANLTGPTATGTAPKHKFSVTLVDLP